jgi:hypothetical protein
LIGKSTQLPNKTSKTPGKTGYDAPPKPGKGEFKKTRVALLVTRWNVDVVNALLNGA